MESLEKEFSHIIKQLGFPFFLVILISATHLINQHYGAIYNVYGIYPRALDGLKGIFFAPLLHSDFHHLFSNAVPLFVLTAVITFFYKRIAISSFVIIYLLCGLSVWLFAREVYHIGASGVVYGLVSFVFWCGVFRRNTRSIVLSLIIVTLYSGYLAGIFPGKEGISWESHLFGGIIGIFVAYVFKDILEPEELEEDPWADEEESTTYYFPRDTFEKTKQQRYLEQQQANALRQQWIQNSSQPKS